MAFDLRVIETGNGGDFINLGNDLAVTQSVSTMIYLSMFGGNVEESTTQRTPNLQSFDYWGNRLLMSSEISQQFNSSTERVLNTTPLNSDGRQKIENAIKEDLKFLSEIFTIFVIVKLPYVDHVTIEIKLIDLDSSKENTLIINLRKTAAGDFSILDFDTNDFLI